MNKTHRITPKRGAVLVLPVVGHFSGISVCINSIFTSEKNNVTGCHERWFLECAVKGRGNTKSLVANAGINSYICSHVISCTAKHLPQNYNYDMCIGNTNY